MECCIHLLLLFPSLFAASRKDSIVHGAVVAKHHALDSKSNLQHNQMKETFHKEKAEKDRGENSYRKLVEYQVKVLYKPERCSEEAKRMESR